MAYNNSNDNNAVEKKDVERCSEIEKKKKRKKETR